MNLLNAKNLAKEINRSEWWVCQARKAGMPFACGLITVEKAWDWMQSHPDFIAKDYCCCTTKHPHNQKGHQPVASGRSRES